MSARDDNRARSSRSNGYRHTCLWRSSRRKGDRNSAAAGDNGSSDGHRALSARNNDGIRPSRSTRSSPLAHPSNNRTSPSITRRRSTRRTSNSHGALRRHRLQIRHGSSRTTHARTSHRYDHCRHCASIAAAIATTPSTTRHRKVRASENSLVRKMYDDTAVAEESRCAVLSGEVLIHVTTTPSASGHF